jgi:hypothetical protein
MIERLWSEGQLINISLEDLLLHSHIQYRRIINRNLGYFISNFSIAKFV